MMYYALLIRRQCLLVKDIIDPYDLPTIRHPVFATSSGQCWMPELTIVIRFVCANTHDIQATSFIRSRAAKMASARSTTIAARSLLGSVSAKAAVPSASLVGAGRLALQRQQQQISSRGLSSSARRSIGQ